MRKCITACLSLTEHDSQTFRLLTLCGGCGHAHDMAAGQRYELQEQDFVSGQGLDLYLKNFQNDFAKTKWLHEEWTSESPHSEYSEVFIST